MIPARTDADASASAPDPSAASSAVSIRPTRPGSLRSRMLWQVLLPLAATWSVGSAIAYALTWNLVSKTFDQGLIDDAYAIAANVIERDGQLELNLTRREVENVLFDRTEDEYFTVVEPSGRIVARNADLPVPPAIGRAAVHLFDAVYNDQSLRFAVTRSESAPAFTVVVGQTTKARTRLSRTLLLQSVVAEAILLLLLGAFLSRRITRELQPLDHLQRELERRDSSDLDPIVLAPISLDVERLRDAVNALLKRIGLGVQAQREFTGNVAHDLRTPLAGIRALAEYGLAQNDPAVWQQQLQRIVASEERASHFVAQLLALALADEARDSVRLDAVRIDEVVRRTVLGFVARADAAGVDLGAVGLDSPSTAFAAPALLEGVLTNLIDNALRYGSGHAGATITVEVAGDAAGRLTISVTDDGPGIDDTERQRLLARWAQGDDGVRLGAGSGLGLAIATRYMTLMGGRLVLERNPFGHGLRALIHLRTGTQGVT